MSTYLLTPRPSRVDVLEYTGDATDLGDTMRAIDPAVAVDDDGHIVAVDARVTVGDLERIRRGLERIRRGLVAREGKR